MERPASVLKGISGDDAKDPALAIRGMPPNFGEHSLPHIVTFQGIISSIARIYRPSDEAIKDSFENARFMRNDCGLMECIEQRQRSTALLNWHLEPDDENDKTQQWLCEQLTAILESTPRFMQYRENLLHAIWFGRYGVSHRLRWKPVRGQMRLTIDRWRPVHGDKLAFRYDDGNQTFDEDQVGIRVGAGFTAGSMVAKRWTVEKINKVEPSDYGLVYFLEPYERSLLAIHKHMIEDGEYEDPQAAGKIHGVGIRSRIYWTWYQAQETLAWMMEYLERSAFGIEIWYYPWGNDEAKSKTRAAAEERIGQGRNIILVPRPLGEDTMAYGVERIEPSMAGLEACQKLVTEFFGHRMKRYILGQTLTSEASSTGLGSNLADIHLASFLQIVKYDATNLEETITTETVEPLKKFNWPRYRDIPIRFRIDTESADTEEKLKAYQSAYQMGMKLKAQDVYDIIGASQPEPGDEVLQDPQHAQAQAQQAQMQAQAAAQQQAARGRSQVSMANRASQVKQVDHALQVNKIMEALGLKDRPGADEPGVGDGEGEPETYDRLPGGAGDGANPNQFDRQQVQKGVREEMEHTADPGIATEIALDHLAENPQYYGQPEPDSESSERRRVVEAYSSEKPREQFSRQDEERIAKHVKSGTGELLIPDERGGVYGYRRDARGGISVEYYKSRKPAAGQKSFGWDESQVVRDDDGKFAEKEGGGGSGEKADGSEKRAKGKQSDEPDASEAKPDVDPVALMTRDDAIKAGKTYQEWMYAVSDAYRYERIPEDAESWKSLSDATVGDFDGVPWIGKRVYVQAMHTPKTLVGTVESAIPRGVVIRHPDGTTSKQSADLLWPIDEWIDHQEKKGKPVPHEAREFAKGDGDKEPARPFDDGAGGKGEKAEPDEATPDELARYDNYKEMMAGIKRDPRPLDQWVKQVREVAGRKLADKSEEPPAKPEPKKTGGVASLDEVPYDLAFDAHRGSSFVPEERAHQRQQEYVDYMEGLHEELKGLTKSPEQEAELKYQFAQFKEGYLSRYKGVLAADARTVSSMITGPSNFPTARNEKRLDAAHAKTMDFLDWRNDAVRRMKKAIHNAAPEDVQIDEETERLKKSALSTIATLKSIEAGEGGLSRSLFTSNLQGKLERAAKNGNYEAVEKTLEFIREHQEKHLKKPVFAKNNRVWQAVESHKSASESKAAEPAKDGEEDFLHFDGATAVRNYDEDRIQITMPGKPSADVRESLKSAGWHWSPRNGVWQRKLTNAAEASAEYILKKHYGQPIEKPE